MADKKVKFLDAEEAVQSLVDELERLRNISNKIDQVKTKSSTVIDTCETVVNRFDSVSRKAESILGDISKINLDGINGLSREQKEFKANSEKGFHDLAKEIKSIKTLLAVNLAGLVILAVLIITLRS